MAVSPIRRSSSVVYEGLQEIVTHQVVCHDDPALTAGHRLRSLEAEATNLAEAPHGLAIMVREMCLRCILNDIDPRRDNFFKQCHIARGASEMNRENSSRFLSDRALD